ncbi:MAG: hypothetical protein ACHQUC_09520 [Chlamydiales bacterium]
MTRDADVVIQIHKPEINKIVQLFQDEFYIDRNAISEAIEYQGMFNAIHNESVFKIDFIVCKDAPYRQTEFERRRQIKCGDQLIWIVTPEDLILSKLEWAKESSSEIQLNDVRNIFSSAKNLDLNYINRWVQKLQLIDIYKKVQANE